MFYPLIPFPLHSMFYLLTVISSLLFFFFNDTATTEIYTLSLHDALPICPRHGRQSNQHCYEAIGLAWDRSPVRRLSQRSEEHTSELQSRVDLVCRLLLEKKKKQSKERLKINKKIPVAVRRDTDGAC